jgi:glutamate-5-semialdehyde dehydrogenase
MPIAPSQDLKAYCEEVARRAKAAARVLATSTGQQKNDWLVGSAAALRANMSEILAANQIDINAAPEFDLTDAQIDRLRLNSNRIEGIATTLEQVAMLPDPIGSVIESSVRPNGLHVQKVRVPLGVVFFIYESRPNVTADAAAICVKSGNSVILRGGKEAANSSQAIVKILVDQASKSGIPEDAVQLVATPDRAAVGHFLAMNDLIDVAVPRGGESLVRRVASEATMPVIKHFEGNCHVYIDKDADLKMAERIVVNSKCQRMGMCNTAESLVVHSAIAQQFLPLIARSLIARQIEIRGDAATCKIVPEAQPATEQDFRKEYLGPKISVKIVESLDAAIDHINTYGSAHTDAIVTNHLGSAQAFTTRVDSSAVMVNASTRFNDGGEFGLGAEIGISTDRFHARGPCGLNELTSYKYVVLGAGQIRE